MLSKLVPRGIWYVCNKLEKLEFKLEKIMGFRKIQENLEKICFYWYSKYVILIQSSNLNTGPETPILKRTLVCKKEGSWQN